MKGNTIIAIIRNSKSAWSWSFKWDTKTGSWKYQSSAGKCYRLLFCSSGNIELQSLCGGTFCDAPLGYVLDAVITPRHIWTNRKISPRALTLLTETLGASRETISGKSETIPATK